MAEVRFWLAFLCHTPSGNELEGWASPRCFCGLARVLPAWAPLIIVGWAPSGFNWIGKITALGAARTPMRCPLKVDSHLSGRPGPYGHSGPDTGQLAGTAKVEHPGPPGDFPAHPACGHCR